MIIDIDTERTQAAAGVGVVQATCPEGMMPDGGECYPAGPDKGFFTWGRLFTWGVGVAMGVGAVLAVQDARKRGYLPR